MRKQFEFQVRKKKTEESKSYKKKMKSKSGAELKARKKKAEGSNTSKEKKNTSNNDVPEFKIKIRKLYPRNCVMLSPKKAMWIKLLENALFIAAALGGPSQGCSKPTSFTDSPPAFAENTRFVKVDMEEEIALLRALRLSEREEAGFDTHRDSSRQSVSEDDTLVTSVDASAGCTSSPNLMISFLLRNQIMRRVVMLGIRLLWGKMYVRQHRLQRAVKLMNMISYLQRNWEMRLFVMLRLSCACDFFRGSDFYCQKRHHL